jgi:hypothetical protein
MTSFGVLADLDHLPGGCARSRRRLQPHRPSTAEASSAAAGTWRVTVMGFRFEDVGGVGGPGWGWGLSSRARMPSRWVFPVP